MMRTRGKSPPKKEPDVSENTPSAPQIPTVKRNDSFGEIVGPYGYGAWRDDDRDADPVFNPPPPARLSRSSSGQDLRGNPFGTIVAPIGTPSIQPPPPPPPVQSTNAAECPCCLQPGRDIDAIAEQVVAVDDEAVLYATFARHDEVILLARACAQIKQ